MSAHDHVLMRAAIKQVSPLLHYDFEALINEWNVVFRGPLVLLAYFGHDISPELKQETPVILQCEKEQLRNVIGSLSKYCDLQDDQTSVQFQLYHFISDPPTVYVFQIRGSKQVVFLMDGPQAAICDIYNISYDKTGFFGSSNNVANLETKTCAFDVDAVKQTLKTWDIMNRFMTYDAVLFLQLNIRVDWNNHVFWKRVWKLIIKELDDHNTNLFQLIYAWNMRASQNFKETDTFVCIPLLYITVTVPYLKQQSLTIGNSLYGAAVFDRDAVQADLKEALAANLQKGTTASWEMAWETIHHMVSEKSTAVVTKIGELFQEESRGNNFLLFNDDKRVLLFDLFEERTFDKPVSLYAKPKQQTCFVNNDNHHTTIASHLQQSKDNFVVFYKTQRGDLEAMCYEKQIVENFETLFYPCASEPNVGFRVDTKTRLWELPIVDSQREFFIVITDRNLQSFHQSQNKYFFLVPLQRKSVHMIANDLTGENGECSASSLRPLHGLVPVRLSKDHGADTAQTIKLIFKYLYENAVRTRYEHGFPAFDRIDIQPDIRPVLRRHISDAKTQHDNIRSPGHLFLSPNRPTQRTRVEHTTPRRLFANRPGVVSSDSDQDSDIDERQVQREQHNPEYDE